jgi:phenylacetate-CoA ligase
MYFFGQNKISFDHWLKEPGDLLLTKQKAFSRIKLVEIITVLTGLGQYWEESGFPDKLVSDLESESGFSSDEVKKSLRILPKLLSRESLMKRISAEFGKPEVLDRFTKLPHQESLIKAVPRGAILHVTAGNVFLSSIDSLVMGLLTKNVSLVKLSSENKIFPAYFAETLLTIDSMQILTDKFAFLHWKGGNKQIEELIKKRVSTIIAWGGEEMISSYSGNLPLGVKYLDFGPKVSIQIISTSGLSTDSLSGIAERVVRDILPWNQGACASPQNLFLQEGIDTEIFLKEIERAFQKAPPRVSISEDESVEILKEKYRGLYSELMEKGRVLSGEDYLLHQEVSSSLRPSPLNRSLILKTFKDSATLAEDLRPFSFYLQSASYLLSTDEKDGFLEDLSSTGIKRFAPLGTVTYGKDGAPHDGRFVLRELVNFVGDELRSEGVVNGPLTNSQDMKKVFESSSHPPGYIFSSGGTTGEPKYVHFSYEEFDFITDMLAKNFRAQGLEPGMTVANLFVAGNLWSSFMAVEKALEKIGVVQLPIGGLATQENIKVYLEKFMPDVVMGIPSLLVKTAKFMQEKRSEFKASRVFYAGEALSESRSRYLKNIWAVERFGSAGYASVDAGVIGYQCSHCGPGEHHLFSDLVQMKIVDGEAVVSSLYRTSLPIRNYRTGDRVEFISTCACGDTNPRFKLLGRADSLLMIWSTRISLEEIEKSLKRLDPGILTYQIVLVENEKGQEVLTLYYELNLPINDTDIIASIFKGCRDLRDSLSLEEFSRNIRIVPVEAGMIPRNSRTGKVPLVIDKRD